MWGLCSYVESQVTIQKLLCRKALGVGSSVEGIPNRLDLGSSLSCLSAWRLRVWSSAHTSGTAPLPFRAPPDPSWAFPAPHLAVVERFRGLSENSRLCSGGYITSLAWAVALPHLYLMTQDCCRRLVHSPAQIPPASSGPA